MNYPQANQLILVAESAARNELSIKWYVLPMTHGGSILYGKILDSPEVVSIDASGTVSWIANEEVENISNWLIPVIPE